MLIVLTEGSVLILTTDTLSEMTKLVKSGAILFATNSRDYIAILLKDSISFFYFNDKKVAFMPLQLGNTTSIKLERSARSLVWNNDTLGIVTKKNYCLVYEGKIKDMCSFGNALHQELLVYEDNWVTIVDDYISIYDIIGISVKLKAIDIQASSKSASIVQVVVLKYYLIVLRSVSADIYNLKDYTQMQEIPFDKSFSYKDYAISEENLYIIKHKIINTKKGIASTLICLKSVPYYEQVKGLLEESNVESAYKVFEQNYSRINEDYGVRKEEFNLEAGWALFVNLEFGRVKDFFRQTNYDPRELLILLADDIELSIPYISLKEVIEHKMSKGNLLEENKTASTKTTSSDTVNIKAYLNEGKKAIWELVEEKRKHLLSKFDMDSDKKIKFSQPRTPINKLKCPQLQTLNEILTFIDTSLIKLYIREKELDRLYEFLSRANKLKCNLKEIDDFLRVEESKDNPYTSQVCSAILNERNGNYVKALDIWYSLGLNTTLVRGIALKETGKLLKNQVKDKEVLMKYAKILLAFNRDEAFKMFAENENIKKILSEDEILNYLKGLKKFIPELEKRHYLEYVIKNNTGQNHLYTRLAISYIKKIQKLQKIQDPEASEYNKILLNYLKSNEKYNAKAVLERIKGLKLYDVEVYLYLKEKEYDKAVATYVEIGSQTFDFSMAENLCKQQSESLYEALFESIMNIYKEYKIKLSNSKDSTERNNLEEITKKLKEYGYKLLKRYADNSKINPYKIFEHIPDDWELVGDGTLMKYLIISLNNQLGKEMGWKIAKESKQMEKVNTEATLAKINRAYLLINPESICKVCQKTFTGSKSFCIYPNGVATHTSCSKDMHVCPVNKINFKKKIYI